MNAFARREVNLKVCRRNAYALIACALKMHFDARLPGIPNSAMTEPRRIKISVKLSIEAMQHVQVEFRSNPAAVVVGCHQRRLIFHHVHAQQQHITGLQLTPEIAKNRPRLLRV